MADEDLSDAVTINWVRLLSRVGRSQIASPETDPKIPWCSLGSCQRIK